MIFVTGPLYAGKKTWIREQLGLTEVELEALVDELAMRRVVIATEVGCGVVPIDPVERERREAAGRLSCLLAERAETVVRVCCGLPQLLKGEWP